jgi:hypothetical protein
MNAKQRAYHKALVRSVHLSKKYRAYYKDHKDEYREVLMRSFGKESSKDLTLDELELFTDWMNGRVDDLPRYNPGVITQAQQMRLRTLWRAYAKDQSDTALLAFVRRVSKKAYLCVEAIDKESATKAIVALSKTLGGK